MKMSSLALRIKPSLGIILAFLGSALQAMPVLEQQATVSNDTGASPVGDPDAYWIYFTDKGMQSDLELATSLSALEVSFNPDSLDRRRRRGTNDSLLNEHDLPLAASYLSAVQQTGVQLRNESRWLNAVSIEAESDQLDVIGRLPFVEQISPVARLGRPQLSDVEGTASDGPLPVQDLYGIASEQLHQIRIPDVHALGYTGAGITIGIADTGFRLTHQAFADLDVTAEWDFIEDDEDTGETTNNQHVHGTMVLGSIGAYQPGSLVGGAYDASFLLAKTEDLTREVPAEEDDWVAGLEWMEANGADLVTSSLGYIQWYSQDDLDGQTAVTTVAANIATSNGLAIVNSAGNLSHDADPTTSHLLAPADGAQVITVGAVDHTGDIAPFSSDGPTADGRMKPEVLARGVATATVNPNDDDGLLRASGTSMSTPLVAAAIALMIDANADMTVAQIRDTLFGTALDAAWPDPLFVTGYGIIDAFAAVQVSLTLKNGIPLPATMTLVVGPLLWIGWSRRRAGR